MNVKEPRPASKSKVHKPRRVAAAVPSAPSRAELDKWIKKARRLPAVRKDLIKRVKAQIAAGTVHIDPHIPGIGPQPAAHEAVPPAAVEDEIPPASLERLG